MPFKRHDHKTKPCAIINLKFSKKLKIMFYIVISETIFKDILCLIFWSLVLIFIVFSCNTTFRPLYPPAFLSCPLFIWAWK